jgi:hypothetical protein
LNPNSSLAVHEIVLRFPRLFLSRRALREPFRLHSVPTLLFTHGSCAGVYQSAISHLAISLTLTSSSSLVAVALSFVLAFPRQKKKTLRIHNTPHI